MLHLKVALNPHIRLPPRSGYFGRSSLASKITQYEIQSLKCHESLVEWVNLAYITKEESLRTRQASFYASGY